MSSILDDLDSLGSHEEAQGQSDRLIRLRDQYLAQQEGLNQQLAGVQMQQLQQMRAERVIATGTRDWAEQQVAKLAAAINLSEISPDEWETIRSKLLPATRMLYNRLDLGVALMIQELALMEKLDEHRRFTVVDVQVSALQGIPETALLLGGS